MGQLTEKTLNAIEKARQKPAHMRHAIALSVAGGFTLVLFLVWVFVLLPYRSAYVAEESKGNSPDNSPLASLKAQVGSAWNNLTGPLKDKKIDWQDEYEKIKSEALEMK